jgi:hypothetical protein
LCCSSDDRRGGKTLKNFDRITSEGFRLALKHSQKVRMESHRDATDNKKKKDPVVLSMKVVVMVLLMLVASIPPK